MTTRIVEWQLPYTWGTGIGIDTNKVISILLREEDNLIKVNGDNELYTDLQLAVNITPTDEFPVWVTVGKVLAEDWWSQNGLILHRQTTSGDYARWLYWADGKLYFDNWTGTWKQVYYSDEVDALFTALRWELATVAFTWDYNDLINRPAFLQMQADWDQTDVNSPDYIKNKPTIPTVNDATLTIQRNGTGVGTFTANSSTNVTANIAVPNIQNNLTSTSTTDGLSAYQGKLLKDALDDLKAIGRFLSLWDASTGQPISFPLSTPYNYQTWDYFLVETVSTATPPVNYKPSGSSYTWTASTATESDELEVWDLYIYDGTVWLLQINHWKSVSFANLAWQPSDNANLASALNAKQDNLTEGRWIDITSNKVTATNLNFITTDIVTVTTTETNWVAPYNTSFKYTNYEIDASTNMEWVEWAVYSIVTTDAMQPDSDHRNLRIRIWSTWDWKPVMQWNNTIYNGNGLNKNVTRLFVYKTTQQPTGALHILTDDNTTYGQLWPQAVAWAFVVDNDWFCGRNNIIFPTTPIGVTEKWSSLCGAYASGVWSSTTAATKVAITPTSWKFYIDREPLFLPTNSYTAGQTLATDPYQYYFGYDLRYTTNMANNSPYVSPSSKVFLWLKNFDITDYSFVPEVSEWIVTLDKLATRFSWESGDIYLFHLWWSWPTYYQLRWNLDFQNSLYKYNVGTGTLESIRIITDKEARSAVKSVNGNTWVVTVSEFTPWWTATTWYVVTKTASGYEWQAPTGWLQVAPNSPITWIKYVWYGTEADYANLNQYYTDTPWDTEFHTF